MVNKQDLQDAEDRAKRQITEQVNALRDEYESKMEEMKLTYDYKIEAMGTAHQRKIEDLELKLSVAIKERAAATLEAITGFYTNIDKKVDKHTIRMSIIEDDTIKSLQTLVENNVTELQRLTNEMSSIRPAMNTNVPKDSTPAAPSYAVGDTKTPTIKSLEARIDKLEDHSRRNNLLFYGFKEDNREQCENRVRDILATKILYNIRDVNTIEIVRAHRLGPFKNDQTRPIIVKFQHYSDKQQILQNIFKGKLNSLPGKWVSEDFSENTTNDRKFLRDQLLEARSELGKKVIKNSSVRYKAIHVTNVNGARSVFPLHKVVENPHWWKGIAGKLPDSQQYPEGNAGRPVEGVSDSYNSEEVATLSKGDQQNCESVPLDDFQDAVDDPTEDANSNVTAEEVDNP